MRTFPRPLLFWDPCVRCAATSGGSAKLNAGGKKRRFSPGVDRTLCRGSGERWSRRGGGEEVRSRERWHLAPDLRQSALLRGCERIPSRRRAADASRRAALLLLAIAPRLCLAYIFMGRLARQAPRPPGSVRGFVHRRYSTGAKPCRIVFSVTARGSTNWSR